MGSHCASLWWGIRWEPPPPPEFQARLGEEAGSHPHKELSEPLPPTQFPQVERVGQQALPISLGLALEGPGQEKTA